MLSKLGRLVSEEGTLQLLKTKSILLYGLEANCPLNKSQISCYWFYKYKINQTKRKYKQYNAKILRMQHIVKETAVMRCTVFDIGCVPTLEAIVRRWNRNCLKKL